MVNGTVLKRFEAKDLTAWDDGQFIVEYVWKGERKLTLVGTDHAFPPIPDR